MIKASQQKLRSMGYRITPQRLAILNILESADRHLTPVQIYNRAQTTIPGLTETTVYRTLNFLTEHGLVLAAHIGGGQLVYEIGGHDHHHLICRACGITQSVDHEFLQELYDQFESRTGFLIDSIHTTFFGLCPGCQSVGAGKNSGKRS